MFFIFWTTTSSTDPFVSEPCTIHDPMRNPLFPYDGHTGSQLLQSDEMRRPVSERDAVRSQVIDALEAQEIKETGHEEG